MNLISSLGALRSLGDQCLTDEFVSLAQGHCNGVYSLLRIAKRCGLRGVGKFKANFSIVMTSQHYTATQFDLYLGPHVHLAEKNSGMRKLFHNFAGCLSHTDVLFLFNHLFRLVVDMLPNTIAEHLKPWDLQHAVCEWMKYLAFMSNRQWSEHAVLVPEDEVFVINE